MCACSEIRAKEAARAAEIEAEIEREKQEAKKKAEEERLAAMRARNAGDRKSTATRTGKVIKKAKKKGASKTEL
jgi:hypothetical protein